MQLGSTFICNCNIALDVSDAFCFHLQESYTQYVLVWMPSTLDALLDALLGTSPRLMSLTRGCYYSF